MVVAVYLDGLAQLNRVAWVFVAPEVGYQHGALLEGPGTLETGLYRAALEALEWALVSGYDKVLVHTDSQALAHQLGLTKAPQKGSLYHLWNEVKAIEGCFFRVAYFWIDQEANREARRAARKIYELHTGETLEPDPTQAAQSVQIAGLYQLARDKGLEPSRLEDQQFLLWLMDAPLSLLSELSREQAQRLTQRLLSLTQAELFRLRVFYLRSLLGGVG